MCELGNKTEYIVSSGKFKNSIHPEIVLGTDSKVRLQFVDSSGNPIPMNAGDRYTVAVDTNFDHNDALMAFTDQVAVIDSVNGVVEAVIPCNTIEFSKKLKGLERITVWIELARYNAGEANAEILLRDTCSALNRVQYGESAPAESSVGYYTAAQVDALLSYKAIALAACSGMGEILENNAFTMTWIDPDNVTLNGAVLAEWNQTVLVRKVGSYPADHTDGTILAATSRALGNKNAYRSSGYTDSDRTEGTTYYYKLFSQTTAGVWNNQDGNEFTETTDLSWGMVQYFVRAGRGPELFPVGTVFEVNHPEYSDTNGHSLLFRVVGHDQVPAADESLTHTMCLDMVYVLFNEQYDRKEAAYALTEDWKAAAGKTYYIWDGSAYTALAVGTDYEVGDDVPPASWYEKNLNGRSDFGSSNPVQSNMIQWANSAGAANQWFEKQTIFDTVPDSVSARNGFCRYIDQDFLAVVKEAKLITSASPVEGTGAVTHYAKFWPLSLTQVTGASINGVAEGDHLEYYDTASSRIKHMISTGLAAGWHLRSPSQTSSIIHVNADGSTTATATNDNSRGYSLACIIA